MIADGPYISSWFRVNALRSEKEEGVTHGSAAHRIYI